MSTAVSSKPKAEFVWLDGQVVPWAEGKLHINTLGVQGGLSVYEVTQAHWNPEEQELFLFRFDEHMRRLRDSAFLARIPLPYSAEEILAGTRALIRALGYRQDITVRLVVYLGEGPYFAYRPEDIATGAFMIALPVNPWPPAGKKGLTGGTTTWERISDKNTPPRIKAGANYQSARLAHMQAQINGYDVPIFLNDRGKVAESHLCNIFLIKKGVAVTPSASSGILEGLTRFSLLEIFPRELGMRVEERAVDKTELYLADECFLSSTSMSEVKPILSVDGYPIGDGEVGPITARLMKIYDDIATGYHPAYRHWLTPVYKA